MFRHILFPIDFSERCKQAVPFVKIFAERYHAKVTLMHVFHIPAGWYGGMDGAYPILFDVEAMENSAREELVKFYSGPGSAEPLTNVAQVVTQGEPGPEIVKCAKAAAVDLIMMPTHGYGGFRRLLLGSVTAQVLHDAQCPVWTAAHAEDDWENVAKVDEMLCAIDGSEQSLPLIRDSVALGRELGANLRLVHAVPFEYPDVERLLMGEPELCKQAARRQIRDLQEKAGTKLQVCMETGNVSDVVRKAALHHNVDLIVMGRGRIRGRLGGLRSSSYAIIRDSPCPVLSM